MGFFTGRKSTARNSQGADEDSVLRRTSERQGRLKANDESRARENSIDYVDISRLFTNDEDYEPVVNAGDHKAPLVIGFDEIEKHPEAFPAMASARTQEFADDGRSLSVPKHRGSARASKANSGRQAFVQRSNSISRLSKRASLKRMASLKRQKSVPLNQEPVVDTQVSIPHDSATSQTRGIEEHTRPFLDENKLSLSSERREDKFEAAEEHADEDVFLFDEATRKDFYPVPGSTTRGRENTEMGIPSQARKVEPLFIPKSATVKQVEKSSSDAAVKPVAGKPAKTGRRRPPPLVQAPESRSISDEPASDGLGTAVFGSDGGFTTGGFKITSEGMVGMPPMATRQDSISHGGSDIPQSMANMVIVRSLKEFRKGPTIGAGAAGRVYLAIHEPSGKTMAIKVVNVYESALRTQLLKELQTLSTYVSKSLVRFYGAFYDGSGAVHIALEYMDRGCLSSFVQKFGSIPERVVQMITADCLRGLRFLHRHHVLHRDFKTGNVLLSRRLCCAKVSDFGLARDLNPGASKVDTFVGTVAYMSPERLHGSQYTYASDIWALGVSVVECLLGRYPFDRPQSYFDYIDAAMTANILSGKSSNGQRFSLFAQDFVKLCTDSDPKRRPTALQLLQHPWITSMNRDTIMFGDWMDDCASKSATMSAKSFCK